MQAAVISPGRRWPPREDSPNISTDSPTPESADRKSTRLNSSHLEISYAVFCLKKKKTTAPAIQYQSPIHPPIAADPQGTSIHVPADPSYDVHVPAAPADAGVAGAELRA